MKQEISSLEDRLTTLTLEDLYRELGDPSIISQGFDTRDDIEVLKRKARKYTRTRIICYLCAIVAVLAIAFSVVIMRENDSYHNKISTDSTTEYTN